MFVSSSRSDSRNSRNGQPEPEKQQSTGFTLFGRKNSKRDPTPDQQVGLFSGRFQKTVDGSTGNTQVEHRMTHLGDSAEGILQITD